MEICQISGTSFTCSIFSCWIHLQWIGSLLPSSQADPEKRIGFTWQNPNFIVTPSLHTFCLIGCLIKWLDYIWLNLSFFPPSFSYPFPTYFPLNAANLLFDCANALRACVSLCSVDGSCCWRRLLGKICFFYHFVCEYMQKWILLMVVAVTAAAVMQTINETVNKKYLTTMTNISCERRRNTGSQMYLNGGWLEWIFWNGNEWMIECDGWMDGWM